MCVQVRVLAQVILTDGGSARAGVFGYMCVRMARGNCACGVASKGGGK